MDCEKSQLKYFVCAITGADSGSQVIFVSQHKGFLLEIVNE